MTWQTDVVFWDIRSFTFTSQLMRALSLNYPEFNLTNRDTDQPRYL
jgi:hypothetical protein